MLPISGDEDVAILRPIEPEKRKEIQHEITRIYGRRIALRREGAIRNLGAVLRKRTGCAAAEHSVAPRYTRERLVHSELRVCVADQLPLLRLDPPAELADDDTGLRAEEGPFRAQIGPTPDS